MSEGRKKVPVEELLKQWDEALESNQAIMAPILGSFVLRREAQMQVEDDGPTAA